MIFDIQRFSLHDGPGIRTTVFLKGCQLHCLWCHNPESISPEQDTMFFEDKCIQCEMCKVGCHSGALTVVGRKMDVGEVLEVLEKDRLFYENSGGGITLSGGEPLMQWQFAAALLKECKSRGFHTAIETNGYSSWEILWQVVEKVDIVLFDIKCIDAVMHLNLTGASNDMILKNLESLSYRQKCIQVRIPVIPGYNDMDVIIERTADFLAGLGLKDVMLIPFHKFGEKKYKALGREKEMLSIEPPTKLIMQSIKRTLAKAGLKPRIV